jgi:uncharacterized protein CbrC (UPF0167 family)
MNVSVFSLTEYQCKKCGGTIRPDDKICPNCHADLSQVGRHISVSLDEKVGVSDEVIATLTAQERDLFRGLFDWLRNNWTLDQIDIGLPSGVKFTFKRKH